MALQSKLGILAQRRHRNDSIDCLDSLAAWICIGTGVTERAYAAHDLQLGYLGLD